MVSPNSCEGFGIWVAFQDTIGSVDKAVQRCKDIGAKWVAPRAGAGRGLDNRWSPAEAKSTIQKYHDAGIRVYPWVYSWPSAADAEVLLFKSFKDQGADGVFIDAEIEWQENGTHHQQAEDFMKKLRAALGDDFFIGHAPFPYLLYHVQFPYVEFGRYCDQVHPQTYWSEISDAGSEHHTLAAQAQWDQYAVAHPEVLGLAKQVCHIGVTYGKEIGGPTPGTFRPSDLKWFMDWCKSRNLVSWSVYSLDAMNPLAYKTLKAINDGTDIPADPAGSGTRTVGLQAGDSGDRVKQLQERLNAIGYTLVADGVFRLGTKTAIQDFQKKHGMQQTGVWTPDCDIAMAAPPVVVVPKAPVVISQPTVSPPVAVEAHEPPTEPSEAIQQVKPLVSMLTVSRVTHGLGLLVKLITPATFFAKYVAKAIVFVVSMLRKGR